MWLASLGWRVTAVDFSSVGLAKGEKEASRRGLRLDWVVADATTWQPDGTYDLAVLAYLQLPADERRAAVRAAYAALAPGGTFLLVAHDSANLTEGVGGPQDGTVLMTAEDVLSILDVEKSRGELVGVIVQFGGQTPLNLARALEAAGIPILGTSPAAIDLAEDREQFAALVDRLKLLQPKNGIARSRTEAARGLWSISRSSAFSAPRVNRRMSGPWPGSSTGRPSGVRDDARSVNARLTIRSSSE